MGKSRFEPMGAFEEAWVAVISANELGGMMHVDKTHNQQKPDGEVAKAYWKANLSLLIKLMTVWFIVSFCCGILFVEQLNAFTFMGMPLGFWFAQQGSIYTFVALIFVYVFRMNKIERDFGVND